MMPRAASHVLHPLITYSTIFAIVITISAALAETPTMEPAISDWTEREHSETKHDSSAHSSGYFHGRLPTHIENLSGHTQTATLSSRLEMYSKVMLLKPYGSDPLGEGEGIDPDPIVRYDVFDCLTYVEEVLALAFSGDPEHTGPIRSALRYGDQTPHYAHRKHFMELQWIPNILSKGWLKDTTIEYGPTTPLSRQITASDWKNWPYRSRFNLTDEELPHGAFSLNVLSLDTAIESASRFRSGSILLVVRNDRINTPLWITHVGFIFQENEPIIRHASKMSMSKQSTDHDLTWFLNHLKSYKNWPVSGVVILEAVDFGPRVGRLTSHSTGKTGPSTLAQ